MNFTCRDARGQIHIFMVENNRQGSRTVFVHLLTRWIVCMEWMQGVRR